MSGWRRDLRKAHNPGSLRLCECAGGGCERPGGKQCLVAGLRKCPAPGPNAQAARAPAAPWPGARADNARCRAVRQAGAAAR